MSSFKEDRSSAEFYMSTMAATKRRKALKPTGNAAQPRIESLVLFRLDGVIESRVVGFTPTPSETNRRLFAPIW
ncbi:MAG: hypothetical protein DMF61_07410 [Blastocatellia bacterium AA13]|nr:MAG: hypothetical protein DMF61_07410 [Blastocatellia bacterium AA13]